MARQKTFLARKSGFVLMSLLISILNVQLPAQEPYPNKQKDFFEMSLEELMDVPVVVSAARQEQKMRNSKPVLLVEDDNIDAMKVKQMFKSLMVISQLVHLHNCEDKR